MYLSPTVDHNRSLIRLSNFQALFFLLYVNRVADITKPKAFNALTLCLNKEINSINRMSHAEQFDESEEQWFSFFHVAIHLASQNYRAEQNADRACEQTNWLKVQAVNPLEMACYHS